MKRKKKNELIEAGMNIGVGSIGLGVAGSITQSVGGNTAGINAFASGLPMIGTAAGAGLAVKQLRKIKK